MDNKHVKRCLPSLIIREIKIITTMRYHLTLVRMAIIARTKINKCQKGFGEKGTIHHWWNCKRVFIGYVNALSLDFAEVSWLCVCQCSLNFTRKGTH